MSSPVCLIKCYHCTGVLEHSKFGKRCFRAGVPNPRATGQYWTIIGPWPVRDHATQQEVRGGQASEASSAAPHRWHYHLNHPSHTHRPWKNCLPRNRSLVPKRLGTAALEDCRTVFSAWESGLWLTLKLCSPGNLIQVECQLFLGNIACDKNDPWLVNYICIEKNYKWIINIWRGAIALDLP